MSRSDVSWRRQLRLRAQGLCPRCAGELATNPLTGKRYSQCEECRLKQRLRDRRSIAAPPRVSTAQRHIPSTLYTQSRAIEASYFWRQAVSR